VKRHDPPGPTPPPNPGGPGRDDYLRVAEVAELWHCDKETVYRAVYGGELPWVDMRAKGAKRARIRIQHSDAHQYMADRKRGLAA
jgi:excisionase family DNA binding protein